MMSWRNERLTVGWDRTAVRGRIDLGEELPEEETEQLWAALRHHRLESWVELQGRQLFIYVPAMPGWLFGLAAIAMAASGEAGQELVPRLGPEELYRALCQLYTVMRPIVAPYGIHDSHYDISA